jgi:hypothetical protein
MSYKRGVIGSNPVAPTRSEGIEVPGTVGEESRRSGRRSRIGSSMGCPAARRGRSSCTGTGCGWGPPACWRACLPGFARPAAPGPGQGLRAVPQSAHPGADVARVSKPDKAARRALPDEAAHYGYREISPPCEARRDLRCERRSPHYQRRAAASSSVGVGPARCLRRQRSQPPAL